MTGIMIKKCSEQQKKKVNDKKVMILQGLLTTWVLSKEKSEWYYELQNSVFLLTFYHLRDEKKKKKYTNLGPDFWNLRQHRRAHFVELDLLPTAKRDKTGTGEDSRFGDIY